MNPPSSKHNLNQKPYSWFYSLSQSGKLKFLDLYNITWHPVVNSKEVLTKDDCEEEDENENWHQSAIQIVRMQNDYSSEPIVADTFIIYS